MPNDIKTLKSSAGAQAQDMTGESKRHRPIVDTSVTAFVWTVSGIALAACVGSSGGGVGGGGAGLRRGEVRVVDGPVQGAQIHLDEDGNGQVEASEIDPDNPDGTTDGNGFAVVPLPQGTTGVPAFVAILNDAVDTVTGEVLTGQLRSLPNAEGNIATPLTDLIALQIKEDSNTNTVDEAIVSVFNKAGEEVAEFRARILDANNYAAPTDGSNNEIYSLSNLLVDVRQTAKGDGASEPGLQDYRAAISNYLGGDVDPDLTRDFYFFTIASSRLPKTPMVAGHRSGSVMSWCMILTSTMPMRWKTCDSNWWTTQVLPWPACSR